MRGDLMWTCLVWAERSTPDNFFGAATDYRDDYTSFMASPFMSLPYAEPVPENELTMKSGKRVVHTSPRRVSSPKAEENSRVVFDCSAEAVSLNQYLL